MRKFGFIILCSVLVASCCNAPELTPFPEVSDPVAITQGPKDHFFASYYGINSWSPDNRYVTVLETDIKDRLSEDGKVSVMLLYGKGRHATLMAFPSIFKGEHVKKTKMISVMKGHEIRVEFEKPCALQIDGETVLGVTGYTVKSSALVREKAEA